MNSELLTHGAPHSNSHKSLQESGFINKETNEKTSTKNDLLVFQRKCQMISDNITPLLKIFRRSSSQPWPRLERLLWSPQKSWCGQAWWLTPVISALWEAEVGESEDLDLTRDQDHPGQHRETPSLLKIQKLAGVVALPVVPTTQEAEAGESLEPKRQRLQWAEMAPLHSRQVTEWDSSKKKSPDA